MDTSAGPEPFRNRVKYEAMFAVLRIAGFGPLMNRTMSIMFGSEFLDDPARRDEVAQWRERIAANDRAALIAFGRGIFARDAVLDRLHEITTPTLVVVGEHDEPQPLPRAQAMVDGIEGARLHIVPGAGHLSTIDNPDDVNRTLVSFLRESP
jgi:3-oxoadipate enol-lactonase